MTGDNISTEKSTIIEKISRWLNEENISTKDTEDEYSDFHTVAKISPTHSIDLVINKDRIDSIILVQNMILSDEDKRAFIRLDKTKKKQFLLDLRASLLHLGIDFAIQPDQERVQFVQVSRRIYFDGITKDRFFDILFQITRALELILVKYETHLYHGSLGQSFLNSVFYL